MWAHEQQWAVGFCSVLQLRILKGDFTSSEHEVTGERTRVEG